MKPTTSSRRKFLTSIGLAAGVAATIPAIKSIEAMQGKKSKWASAKGDPKPIPFLAHFKPLKPVGTVSRVAGTCQLPLAGRPA